MLWKMGVQKEFSLKQMFKFYDQKYSLLNEHLYAIIRSLGFCRRRGRWEKPKNDS